MESMGCGSRVRGSDGTFSSLLKHTSTRCPKKNMEKPLLHPRRSDGLRGCTQKKITVAAAVSSVFAEVQSFLLRSECLGSS